MEHARSKERSQSRHLQLRIRSANQSPGGLRAWPQRISLACVRFDISRSIDIHCRSTYRIDAIFCPLVKRRLSTAL